MVQSFQSMIDAWSVDLYAGWSVMDLFYSAFIIGTTVAVVNYFFSKADSK